MTVSETYRDRPVAHAQRNEWSISQRLLLLASFALFIGYYSLCSFKVPWLGDFNRHVAAVHALYEDFRHPIHEAMPLEGKYTEEYNPLNVAAAAFGRFFELSEYGALQWIGVMNLFLYAYAVCLYFRTTSVLPNSALPPAFFLVFSLFLRNRTWIWASETSFDTLALIQAYPSFLGWSLALLIFALVERLFDAGRRRYAVTIALLFSILILTHLITASWVLGIMGVRAIFELCVHSKLASGEKRTRIFLLYSRNCDAGDYIYQFARC